jgi:cellulose synthase/poly-beta-1,6-N-acetylglucosamine synthase-like glycosyltransferase
MLFIFLFIGIIYSLLIIAFSIGFGLVKMVDTENFKAENSFSIIIPFRNEGHNLTNLLNSISRLNYPKSQFEVLLVNDDSTDDFRPIIDSITEEQPELNLKLINNIRATVSPKKDAINTAIDWAQFGWVVSTDADCTVPNSWLQLFNQVIVTEQPEFICGPVRYVMEHSLLFHFQNLNFLGLIGSTIGGFGLKFPFMCNGANLCYRKTTFKGLQGFEGNEHIASGDDIFMLEKMLKFKPQKIHFLKSSEAVVATRAKSNWTSFFNQQQRWAAKATAAQGKFSKFVGLSVFLMNLIIVLGWIYCLFNPIGWIYLLGVYSVKLLVDGILILKTDLFLKGSKTSDPGTSLNFYFLISMIYPFFTIAVALYSQLLPYKWKSRQFSK